MASHLNMEGLEQIFYNMVLSEEVGFAIGEQVSVFQFPQILLLIISCMEVARSRSGTGCQKWLQVKRYQLSE